MPHLRERPQTLPTFRAREADRILSSALEMEPESRADYLAETCGVDTELRREVEALLRASDETDVLLRPGGAFSPELVEDFGDQPLAAADSRVGRYRLLEEIGRGGMGVVYLAERADGQFEQRVALKMLPFGSAGTGIARFTRERQILAQLEHPGIARLIDGGVTRRGQPFLVMEYVEGVPIDRYCRENDLGLRERIELLIEVCHAVEAAHHQLVIHRDLKPVNILVSSEGRVKLLDFGIAKILEQDVAATHTGERVLTLQYASPEQLSGRPVRVASDVYQLGLLAYELLAGDRPYELSELTPIQALEEICELDPLPPSATRELSAEEHAFRGAELRGDLDAIVLAALYKEPERRYASVDRLREDLEHYLVGRPVSARRSTPLYKARKFTKRHALAVSLSAMTLITLIALSALFTWRLARERDQTRLAAEQAERERVAAEERRQESEKVAKFLTDLFDDTDPLRPNGADSELSALELLEKGAERLEGELDEHPLIHARLLHTVGSILSRRGRYAEAQSLLEKAVDLRRDVPEDRRLELAESLHALGALLVEQGQSEALEILREALGLFEELLGPESPRVSRVLFNLGGWSFQQGDYAEAERLSARSAEILRKQPVVDNYRYGSTLIGQGASLSELGRYDEALESYSAGFSALRQGLPDDHPLLAIPLENIAIIHSRRGQYDEALEYFRQGVEFYERALGTEHPLLAHALENMAGTYLRMGEFEEAEKLLQRAFEIHEKSYGTEHYEVAGSLVYLAKAELGQGRLDQAESTLRRAIEIQEKTLKPEHHERGVALAILGEILVAQGRDDEVLSALHGALEIIEASQGPESRLLAPPLLELAQLYTRSGEPTRAEPLYRRALAIHQETAGPGSSELQEAVGAYAAFLRQSGREAEAKSLLAGWAVSEDPPASRIASLSPRQ